MTDGRAVCLEVGIIATAVLAVWVGLALFVHHSQIHHERGFLVAIYVLASALVLYWLAYFGSRS